MAHSAPQLRESKSANIKMSFLSANSLLMASSIKAPDEIELGDSKVSRYLSQFDSSQYITKKQAC